MLWQQHNGFDKDYKKISKKQRGLDDGFKKVKKLLAIQFDASDPQPIIAPGKLHHISSNENAGWSFWKVEVMVSGLKPSLWPRIWFVVSGDTIIFLAINTHNTGYNDNSIESLALDRYSDIAD